VAKDASGAVLDDRSWVYDGQLRVIAELNASGALRSRYLYASSGHSPDLAVTFDPNTGEVTGSYLLVHDQVGSVVRTVDLATGLAVESVEYDPWGVATLAPGGSSVHPFGFAGGLWDRRTGLVRFGAREYDAGLGRWLARDPIGFAGGWNQYGYVGNLPAGAVDPQGLCSDCKDFDEFGPNAAGAEWLSRLMGKATGRAGSFTDFLGHLLRFPDRSLGDVQVFSHGAEGNLYMFGGMILPGDLNGLAGLKNKFGPHGRLILNVCHSGSSDMLSSMSSKLGIDVYGPNGDLFHGPFGAFWTQAAVMDGWTKCDKNGICTSERPWW
jgi:RHS repeat-associated protein